MAADSLTALVVDDNEAMRYVVGRILREAGFCVIEAATGSEALTLSAQLPDVVVLDVNLPDISGFDVCRIIKRNPATSSIPVVHLSAQTPDAIARSGRAAGADAYLTQPIPREELVTTIGALVGKHRAPSPHGEQTLQARQFLNALREKNQTIAAFFQACPLAIVALDRAGLVTAWNAAAEKIFGWSEAEVLGRTVPYYRESDREELNKVLREMEEASGVVGYETTRQRRDGSLIEVSVSRAPLANASGEVTGCIVVAEDISERRRAERLLQQSEKMMAAGRLAASLAHEINNPLESLTNLIYLLHRTPLDPAASQYLAMAQTELSRITSMSRQLLGFFPEAAAPVQVDVASLLDSVLEVHSRQIEAHGIKVRKDYDGNCRATALPGELRHTFSNLISNALQASAQGGTLTVRAAAGFDWRHPQRRGLRVTIVDNGRGIPAEIRSRIFEPFFTTRTDHGAGLGLWLVQSIVQRREGSVRARSSVRPGRSGTSVSVFWANTELAD